MTIVDKTIRFLASDANINLAVSQSGLQISVAAGNFKVSGTDYTLDTQQDFTAQNQANDCLCVGYLKRDTATQAISVLVDEIVDDGVDESIIFNDLVDTEILFKIFEVLVPANSTTLDGETITRIKTNVVTAGPS